MAHVHLEFVWHLFTFIVLSRVILATGIIDPFLIDKALALKSNWEKNLKNPASSSSVKTKVTVWCKQLFTNTYTLSTVNHYKILQNCKPNHLCIKMLIRWKDLDLVQSLKWKFEYTGPNQIFEFIFYIVLNKKQKNLVVQTKFYWSEARRIVLIIS